MVKLHPRQNQRLKNKLRDVARHMRREPTPAEEKLWQCLRGSQLDGYRFHRQYSIDRFIVDFYCARKGLIIEVDGDVHKQQIEADQEREEILTSLGYRVIRFKNDQVLDCIDEVLQQINQALYAIKGTPSPKSGFDDFGEGAGG